MSETAAEILVKARGLIARPGGWTQRMHARDAEGLPADLFGDQAVSFSAHGALQRVGFWLPGDAYDEAKETLRVLAQEQEFANHIHFNDTPGRTQAEVVALYDAAIARLEAQG